MHSKSRYHKLRKKYLPDRIKLIFLLESPPASGDYFYDPAGRTTEQLFSAMMKLPGKAISSSTPPIHRLIIFAMTESETK
jgi:hypothetical protein